jgi:hypothetical protein
MRGQPFGARAEERAPGVLRTGICMNWSNSMTGLLMSLQHDQPLRPSWKS